MKCTRYHNEKLKVKQPGVNTTYVSGTLDTLFELSRYRQIEMRRHAIVDENNLAYNQENCTIRIDAGRQAGHTIAAFEFAINHPSFNTLIIYPNIMYFTSAMQKYMRRYHESPPSHIRMSTWMEVNRWTYTDEIDYSCIVVDNAATFLSDFGMEALVKKGNQMMHLHTIRHYILLG